MKAAKELGNYFAGLPPPKQIHVPTFNSSLAINSTNSANNSSGNNSGNSNNNSPSVGVSTKMSTFSNQFRSNSFNVDSGNNSNNNTNSAYAARKLQNEAQGKCLFTHNSFDTFLKNQ
mmetsp:Transcript_5753/g.4947  ORF Transcript_5753/g.4947 Transcript_5753/m.4947 type:complete len:117 (+) Transcript_5753:1248-1598(+)